MRDTVTAPGLSGEAPGCEGVVDTTGGARGHSGRATGGRRGRRIQRDSSLGLGFRVVVRARDFKPAARGPSNAGRSLFDGVAVLIHLEYKEPSGKLKCQTMFLSKDLHFVFSAMHAQ